MPLVKLTASRPEARGEAGSGGVLSVAPLPDGLSAEDDKLITTGAGGCAVTRSVCATEASMPSSAIGFFLAGRTPFYFADTGAKLRAREEGRVDRLSAGDGSSYP
jgi:hypothetical protein